MAKIIIIINGELYAETESVLQALILLGAKYGAVRYNTMREDGLVAIDLEKGEINVIQKIRT